jgi:hypothetical protein
MTSQTSMALSLTAYPWPAVSARPEGFVRVAINVAKRNHHLAQGCFPMTD